MLPLCYPNGGGSGTKRARHGLHTVQEGGSPRQDKGGCVTRRRCSWVSDCVVERWRRNCLNIECVLCRVCFLYLSLNDFGRAQNVTAHSIVHLTSLPLSLCLARSVVPELVLRDASSSSVSSCGRATSSVASIISSAPVCVSVCRVHTYNTHSLSPPLGSVIARARASLSVCARARMFACTSATACACAVAFHELVKF